LKQEKINCGKSSSTLDNFMCNLVSTPTRLMHPKLKLDHQFLFTHLSLKYEILIYRTEGSNNQAKHHPKKHDPVSPIHEKNKFHDIELLYGSTQVKHLHQ
jgi:hypothetical protein